MKRFIFLLVVALCWSGCSSTDVYKEVFRDEEPSYNSKEFDIYPRELYPIVQKIVCSKNFIIDEEDESAGVFLAKRYFQRGKRRMILTLQSKIISSRGDNAFLYLNAMQTTERNYVADRTRFFLWVIPLPGGGGKQSTQVKEGEKIVEDRKFYADFFAAIQDELEAVKAAEEVLAMDEAANMMMEDVEEYEVTAEGDVEEVEDAAAEEIEEIDQEGAILAGNEEAEVGVIEVEETILDQKELGIGVTIDDLTEESGDVVPLQESATQL